MEKNNNRFQNYEVSKKEVSFVNHNMEFLNFFETHKNICDKISGLKPVRSIDSESQFFIGKENFLYAINHVFAFIINFRYGVVEVSKKNDLMSKFESLKSRFLDDKEYEGFVKKADNLSNSQLVDFNKLYLGYLMECFDIVDLVGKYLQGHLNITSQNFAKMLKYFNYEGFNSNLNEYRHEVSHHLSMLNHNNIYDVFKKVIGFAYTYKNVVPSKVQVKIELASVKLLDIITSEYYVRLLIKFRDGNASEDNKRELKFYSQVISDFFALIIDECNVSFSNVKLLPKVEDKVLVDRSLI